MSTPLDCLFEIQPHPRSAQRFESRPGLIRQNEQIDVDVLGASGCTIVAVSDRTADGVRDSSLFERVSEQTRNGGRVD